MESMERRDPLPVWQQAALLGGITFAVFSASLSADFVYDARMQILTGDFIYDPGNWLAVLSFRVLGMDVLDFNRPAMLASLMLDAAVWGREPFGYHLTSLLLHVVNVLLVWAVLRQAGSLNHQVRGGRSDGLSCFLATLVFALHPVVTEAVSEPTFREDLLVASFTLGAILLAMRHEAASGIDHGRALGCAAYCLCAVASKESGLAAPLLMAVYWWLFRRNEPQRFWQAAIGGGAAASAAFLAARFLLEPAQSAIFETRPQYPGGSFQAAMAIQPQILALYAQLIVLPVNLSADYGLHSVRYLPLPVSVLILAALVVAAAFAIRSDRRMSLAVALVALPLLPVSNLFPIYRAAADRYLYLPMAGVAVALGLLLDAPWLRARGRIREACLFASVGAIALLGMGSIERQKVWTDSLNLWEDTARKNPLSSTAASGLGEALREVGRLPEAEQSIRVALRLSDEKRADPWAMLALILDEQGRPEEADKALRKALEIDPRLADPDGRVRSLAMERSVADGLQPLLERLNRP